MRQRFVVEKMPFTLFIFPFIVENMATLKPIVVPAKVLKGGKHKVRIALSHNAETRYIVTDIIIDSAKEFKDGQIVKRNDAAAKNTKLRRLLQEYQGSADEINNIECLSCPELLNAILQRGKQKSRTIQSVFEEYVQSANIKPKSVAAYNSNFNSLKAFTRPDFLVEHINHRTVVSYDKWLRDQKYSNDTIKAKMILLSIIVNYSQRCLYAEYPVNPFAGYKMPESAVRQSWLTVDEVRAIRDVKTTKKNIIKCRDVFMLSYYLGGINVCDLVKINFDEAKDALRYVRTKTDKTAKINKFVEFEIPDEAKQIIEKYKGADGKLHFLKDQETNFLCSLFRYNIAPLAELAGIKYLIYYSARKSFSQHAFLLDINTGVIDYILGHKIGKAGSSLYSYIEVTPNMATNAIRKVLDNLK